jgi:hypothetical protein
MMRSKIALLSGLAGLLPALCSAQAPLPPGGSARLGAASTQALKPTGAKSGLTERISTDKKLYTAAEPITMTVTLRNTTRSDIALTFTSGQKFDFQIYPGAKPQGAPLWTWSKGRMFTEMVSTETLKPAAILEYTAILDPRKTHGAGLPLSPGAYTVVGKVVAAPADAISVGVTFRVK